MLRAMSDPIIRVPPGFEAEWSGAQADATEIILNVIRTGEALLNLVEAFVKARGLPSSSALIVLEILRGEGGPLTPSEVASRGFLSRPALSGVMTTLEHRGLLRRSPHPTDRRQTLVEITAKGLHVLEKLLPELHRAEVTWTSGLTKTQKATLLREIGRLHGHLEGVS